MTTAPAPTSPDPRGPSSVTPGLYNNADGSPLVALIDSAKSTLDIEIYDMDDPDVLAALRGALARKVQIRIVKEPKPLGACAVFDAGALSIPSGGATDLATNCADQQKLVGEVNAAGGKYVEFNKTALCGGANPSASSCFQHGKIVVADGRVALVSTGNFNATNLCDTRVAKKCDRDYSVITEDSEVISALTAIVNADVAGKSYDLSSILTPAVAAKLTVSPLSMNPLVAFIKTARKRIQIQNQYLKDATLNAAIMAAAKSGVQVELMVASVCAFGTPKPSESSEFQAIFSQFDHAGISSAIFDARMTINGLPGYLHAKTIVVDGQKAWVGSVNGSTESITRNREFGVFVDDPAQVAKLSGVMENDFRDSNAETWKQSLACSGDH